MRLLEVVLHEYNSVGISFLSAPVLCVFNVFTPVQVKKPIFEYFVIPYKIKRRKTLLVGSVEVNK